ncbi:DUF488 family protein [Halobacteriales archaeon Cl-PHB]
MTDAGGVDETYHAAVQHDLAGLSGEEFLVGVVRRPTGWFRSTVDANYPELGPPEDLLSETKDRQEDLQMQGMCDEGAHNAAWEETNFEERYLDYVSDAVEAQDRLDDLAERVASGESVVLVCFEGEDKRCHRHLLVDELQARR